MWKLFLVQESMLESDLCCGFSPDHFLLLECRRLTLMPPTAALRARGCTEFQQRALAWWCFLLGSGQGRHL